jgi:hypothetical protein
MTQRGYQYRTDWLRKANEEGRVEGARQALALVLEARGIALSEAGRARVDACSDIATLDRWVARAATVSSETELFTEE